jgi:hypothetical protein
MTSKQKNETSGSDSKYYREMAEGCQGEWFYAWNRPRRPVKKEKGREARGRKG